MRRLFVGLPIPQDVALRLSLLQGGLAHARWVDTSNMHITLAFIGAVEELQAREIDSALSEVTGPRPEIALKDLGVFGHKHQRKTLWAGIAPDAALMTLQGRVDSALRRAGVETEQRSYTPHVTLARMKDTPDVRVAAYLTGHGGFFHPTFCPESFVLFESHLQPEGAVYSVLAEYPLAE